MPREPPVTIATRRAGVVLVLEVLVLVLVRVLVLEVLGAGLVVMPTTMRPARRLDQGIASPACAARDGAHCRHDSGEVPRARRVPADAPRPDPPG
jgi:hypothetical protein